MLDDFDTRLGVSYNTDELLREFDKARDSIARQPLSSLRRRAGGCSLGLALRSQVGLDRRSALQPGRYELVFYVDDYFRALDRALPSPAFVADVVLRFGIANAAEHYHVPLLVSPWSYSTYRGS